MIISLTVKDLQHIATANLIFDMTERNVLCITGKNGVGKTSLIKILNLTKDINTFETKGYQSAVISQGSNISISIEQGAIKETLEYKYDESKKQLNTNAIAKSELKVELPIPNGSRFTSYPKLGKIDKELREEYLKLLAKDNKKQEVIDFLLEIYPHTPKFNDLVEINISDQKYYLLPIENNKYIREDYFSSGEYFVLSIYKMLTSKKDNVIIIDEIDISLDASAQVNLVKQINSLCQKYNKKVIFTTHSIVIMRAIYEELNQSIYYLENTNGELSAIETSYAFVIGQMFGFQEYDKYILTEDIVLEGYIKYILAKIGEPRLKKQVRTLYIGGAEEVKEFLRGSRKNILKKPSKDIIAILDGDKSKVKLKNRIFHVPFESVEKEILVKCKGNEVKYNLPKNFRPKGNCGPKAYYKDLYGCLNKKFTYQSIVDILEEDHEEAIDELKQIIKNFLDS